MIALKSENDFFNNIGIEVFPTILLVDTDGNFIYKHEGYSKSSENIIENKISEIIKR